MAESATSQATGPNGGAPALDGTADASVDPQIGAFLQLLLDVMYADVVLSDRCCRRVGDALVTEQEALLKRALAATAGVLPGGVQKAISTYCVRHVLLRSPELLLTSSSVAEALVRLAGHLRESEAADPAARERSPVVELAVVAKGIEEDVAALREKLETKRYAHLVDIIGEAVVGYMSIGAHEMRAAAGGARGEGRVALTTSHFGNIQPSIARFATHANAERTARKRHRAEELDKGADALLFPAAASATAAPPTAVATAAAEGRTAPLGEVAGARSFEEEVREAMMSPDVSAITALPAPQPPSDRPVAAAQPRPLRRPAVQDDVHDAVAALVVEEEAILPGADTPDTLNISTITVERSGGDFSVAEASSRGRGGRRTATVKTVAVGASEASILAMMEGHSPDATSTATDGPSAPAAVEASETASPRDAALEYVLASREVVERSYFLCGETNRYEPVVSRGFFQRHKP